MADRAITTDWEKFKPREYLTEYYSELGSENLALLRFLLESYQDVPSDGVLLDFGGGPTIYPLIAAANNVREIHCSDYLDANLEEIRKWLRNDEAAFDWRPFIHKTLELENTGPCLAADIARRESQIRKRVTELMHCDASRTPPIDGREAYYDIVVTNFCADSATLDRCQWRAFMHNISSLLKPGGKLILSALEGATRYAVGRRAFPAVDIAEADLGEVLTESGFTQKSISINGAPADRPSRLYRGLLLAVATKQRDGHTERETC